MYQINAIYFWRVIFGLLLLGTKHLNANEMFTFVSKSKELFHYLLVFATHYIIPSVTTRSIQNVWIHSLSMIGNMLPKRCRPQIAMAHLKFELVWHQMRFNAWYNSWKIWTYVHTHTHIDDDGFKQMTPNDYNNDKETKATRQ